jgi:hypothetical protein
VGLVVALFGVVAWFGYSSFKDITDSAKRRLEPIISDAENRAKFSRQTGLVLWKNRVDKGSKRGSTTFSLKGTQTKQSCTAFHFRKVPVPSDHESLTTNLSGGRKGGYRTGVVHCDG